MARNAAARYDAHVQTLWGMVEDQRKHVAAEPGCTAAPLCLGREGMQAFRHALIDAGWTASLALAAVTLLRTMQAEAEAQRGMLRDAAAALEQAAQESEEKDAQIRAQLAVVGGLQAKISAYEAAS